MIKRDVRRAADWDFATSIRMLAGQLQEAGAIVGQEPSGKSSVFRRESC